jgi:hypothetical protein
MIFLEKYEGETKLEGWSYSFNGIDELIRFIKKNKFFILGSGYKIEIKQNPDFRIQEYLLKKEDK